MIALMVVVWTVNFVAGKIALRHLSVAALTPFRLELAAAVMAVIYFVSGKLKGQRAKVSWADLKVFAVLGILGVVINQGGFTVGLAYTTVSHSAIIIALAPVTVLLMARWAGLEKISGARAVGVGICVAGAAVLASESWVGFGGGTLKGDAITFVSVVAYAAYAVIAKPVVAKYDTITMNFFMFVTAAIVLAPLTVAEATRLDWGAVGWAGWLGMAYMGICSSVVGYMIYYWALRHMEASRLAATTYIEPVLAILLGVIFVGERVTARSAEGGLLILAGVYVAEKYGKESVTPAAPV
jgi:drug/metabolite transporter (DMT)-like permease